MQLTTTTSKHMVTTVVVSEENVPFNVRVDSPKHHPTTCVIIDLGYDKSYRSVALRMSIEEVGKLQERLARAVEIFETNDDKW